MHTVTCVSHTLPPVLHRPCGECARRHPRSTKPLHDKGFPRSKAVN